METRFRIVGFFGGRERVVADNLTKAQAEEKMDYLRSHPITGMTFCIETLAAAKQWEATLARMSSPHAAR
jgi:hypothetical protein